MYDTYFRQEMKVILINNFVFLKGQWLSLLKCFVINCEADIAALQ